MPPRPTRPDRSLCGQRRFAAVLTNARIRDALNERGVTYRRRVFGPITTIWGSSAKYSATTTTAAMP